VSYIIGVDSGGTFTDCVVLDGNGDVTRAKAPSTPPRFEEGVVNSVTEAARRLGISLSDLLSATTMLVHGTTVATNIVITRTGAKVALLTTRGHEDAVIIGRSVQKVAGLTESEIINVAKLSKADHLVPRSNIYGVDERVDRNGQVVVPLDLDSLDGLPDVLREEGIEAIAVSFLWSFLNPEHERRVGKWLAETAAPNGHGWSVATSSDLAPVIREYERTSTTVLNAYVTPGVSGYLTRMRDRLQEEGHEGGLAVMHSAGGVSSIDEARERGVTLLSSGPAGGMLGARALAERLELDPVIATDVGGTSFDIGVVVDGEPVYAEAPVFSKYPVALPVIDVASIGAGGGSIAWIEAETGVLKVGPQSAGASPGPACYDTGGTRPTVTDANVVLGRINPGYFLGGKVRLNYDRAVEVVRDQIAEPLGMTTEAAAAAIIEIVDSQMADLIRKVTVERGLDPARFAIFGYGGAAGLHVGAYAKKLGCGHVVIPQVASVFSAFGIALSDVKRVEMVSSPMSAPFDLARWQSHFETLEASLREDLQREKLPTADLVFTRAVDLQFKRQVHTVRVTVDDDDLAAGDGGERVIQRFTTMYEARNGPGTAYSRAGVEAMTFVVECVARLPVPSATPLPLVTDGGAPEPKEVRPIYFQASETFEEVPVFEADALRPGEQLVGPALIEALDTTVLVHHGQPLWVDGYLNLRMDLRG